MQSTTLVDSNANGAVPGGPGSGISPSISSDGRFVTFIAYNQVLIRDMTDSWDPTKYQDEYRREVLAFIHERAKRGDVEEAPAPARPKREKGEVIDLMELLKRSVARRGHAAAGRRRSQPRARRSA